MTKLMTQTTSAPGGSRTPWGSVVMLGALSGFAPMSLDLYLPSLPQIGERLHATAGQTQGTVAAFVLGMAVGQFFYGPASDRLGRRPPLLLGIGIYIAASVVCALATNIEVLIAGRFVQALGGCAGAVVSRAIVRDRFSAAETARMLSLMMLIMGVAPILAPLLGGAFVTYLDWRACFWALALFGVAVGAAAFLRLPESRSAETLAQAGSESPLRAYFALFGNRRVVGYALVGALNGAMFFTYLSNAADLIIRQYGVSPAHFGWVFGVNAVGVIGGSQVNRYLLRRLTYDQVLTRATLAAAGLGVLFVIAVFTGFGERWTVLPLLFGLLSTYGFTQGNAMAGALNSDPARAGASSSLLGGSSFATGAAAATLSATLADGTPRPLALIMCSAQVLSVVALWLLARKRSVQA
jgi:DHA1 family bicyclomycin/chloramphenicol resistance-like MFS transporter